MYHHGVGTIRQGRQLRRLASLIIAAALAMPLMMSSGPFANAAAPGKGGPLTPRLQLLADPAFDALSPEAQAEKLGLDVSGPGSIMKRPGGRILVDVRLSDSSAATLDRLEAAEAYPVYVDDARRIVTAEVAPSALTALAAVQPEVLSVQEVLQPATNACPTGVFVSEGDTQLNAATGRTHYAVNGSGITVGVISDSYNSLGTAATDVTNGELPGATNACGFTTPVAVQADSGTSDEGRAMAQIVHDLAPGANLRFATANGGEAAFAQQIRDLATAGAKVIVDDITYLAEPMYQDGVVGKAVEDVIAGGVTYFSSAGNENTIVGGNDVGSYETLAYRPTTCPASVVAADPGVLDCHDFNPTVTVDNTYGITLGGTVRYVLGWNEPQFGVVTDLDLCILNHANGAVLACSLADNLGTQNTFETFSGSFSGSADLVVARYAGTATPRLKLVSWRSAITAADYPTSSGGDVVGPTTFGHNASRSGATVAAIPYNNANTLETYSSRGPATYCYGPVVGTTPAAPLGSCETATVDMSGTDGVQNSFFGGGSPNRFFGTSAAAPHAAAVAALVLERAPCLTPAQVLTAMKSTALPIGAFGADAMGAGRLDADAAIGAAGTCGAPLGFLRVTSSPAVPAQISLNGVIADSWGLNWVELPPGDYTVHFSHVEGYTEPADELVSVTAGLTTTVTGTFTQRGSLRVQTSPAVAGQVSVDGIPRNDWGMWTDLPTGAHQVCFGPVAGYTPPACQNITVNAGALTSVTGTYTVSP